MNLLVEAIAVGIMILILGEIVMFILKKVGLKGPCTCTEWNKYYIREISLFLTGFLGHLLFELVGANKWYCKHGSACSKSD